MKNNYIIKLLSEAVFDGINMAVKAILKDKILPAIKESIDNRSKDLSIQETEEGDQ